MKKLNTKGAIDMMIVIGLVVVVLAAGILVFLQSNKTSDEPSEAQEVTETKSEDMINRENDADAKTDLNAMHAQLEAFYADNGYYPGLADLYSDEWVSTNLPGLDQERLSDQNGIRIGEADSLYSYTVSPEDCEACNAYELSTTLSDGSQYSKASLN